MCPIHKAKKVFCDDVCWNENPQMTHHKFIAIALEVPLTDRFWYQELERFSILGSNK